jgi:hypothetical protein
MNILHGQGNNAVLVMGPGNRFQNAYEWYDSNMAAMTGPIAKALNFYGTCFPGDASVEKGTLWVQGPTKGLHFDVEPVRYDSVLQLSERAHVRKGQVLLHPGMQQTSGLALPSPLRQRGPISIDPTNFVKAFSASGDNMFFTYPNSLQSVANTTTIYTGDIFYLSAIGSIYVVTSVTANGANWDITCKLMNNYTIDGSNNRIPRYNVVGHTAECALFHTHQYAKPT